MSTHPHRAATLTLEEILQREDIWRGRLNQAETGNTLDTGHAGLNNLLLHGGWPLAALVEICQQRFQGEWQLFLPALLSLDRGLVVLLNPPAEPFSQAMIQAGVDLDRLVVVNAGDRQQFLTCFRELARTRSCAAVLGWQPEGHLSYTDLRKCLLAAADGRGLYSLFRPAPVQQQSSPAQLRLFCKVIPAGLEVTVFKQKGMLESHRDRPVVLPLPAPWQAAPPYPALDGALATAPQTPPRAPVARLRGRR